MFIKFYTRFRVQKPRLLAFSRCSGGFRKLPEAGRKNFHLSWYLSVPVVTSYDQKPQGGFFSSGYGIHTYTLYMYIHSVFHAESETAVRIDQFLHSGWKTMKNRPTRVCYYKSLFKTTHQKIKILISCPGLASLDLGRRLYVQFLTQNLIFQVPGRNC